MQPGTSVTINPPIPVSGGLRIDGMMVGGFTGDPPFSVATPFLATDIVHWDVEAIVRCLDH